MPRSADGDLSKQCCGLRQTRGKDDYRLLDEFGFDPITVFYYSNNDNMKKSIILDDL
jgi:hypothetical protein